MTLPANKLSDLDITKRCAEAMGIDIISHEGDQSESPYYHDLRYGVISYWPLTDDAQAMALVKRFKPYMQTMEPPLVDTVTWVVSLGSDCVVEHADLNRAICECVARIKP